MILYFFSHFFFYCFGNVSLRVSVLSCELFPFFGIRSASQPFHADKIYGKAFCIMISFFRSLSFFLRACILSSLTRNFLFPLDAMTVNHHGKYFIIRNDLRRGQNGMNEMCGSRQRESEGERAKGKRTREQSRAKSFVIARQKSK